VSSGSAIAGPGTHGDSPSPAVALGPYIGRIGVRMFWHATKRGATPSGVAAAHAKRAKLTPKPIRDDETRQSVRAVAAASRLEAQATCLTSATAVPTYPEARAAPAVQAPGGSSSNAEGNPLTQGTEDMPNKRGRPACGQPTPP
jgi:hypothetical protein